jgi:hypothetical protein
MYGGVSIHIIYPWGSVYAHVTCLGTCGFTGEVAYFLTIQYNPHIVWYASYLIFTTCFSKCISILDSYLPCVAMAHYQQVRNLGGRCDGRFIFKTKKDMNGVVKFKKGHPDIQT